MIKSLVSWSNKSHCELLYDISEKHVERKEQAADRVFKPAGRQSTTNNDPLTEYSPEDNDNFGDNNDDGFDRHSDDESQHSISEKKKMELSPADSDNDRQFESDYENDKMNQQHKRRKQHKGRQSPDSSDDEEENYENYNRKRQHKRRLSPDSSDDEEENYQNYNRKQQHKRRKQHKGRQSPDSSDDNEEKVTAAKKTDKVKELAAPQNNASNTKAQGTKKKTKRLCKAYTMEEHFPPSALTIPVKMHDGRTSLYTKNVSHYSPLLCTHNPPTEMMFSDNGDVVIPNHEWSSQELNDFYNAPDLGEDETMSSDIKSAIVGFGQKLGKILVQESVSLDYLATPTPHDQTPTQFDIIPGFKGNQLHTEKRLSAILADPIVKMAWASCQKETIDENGAKIPNPAYTTNPKKCEAKQRRILIAMMHLVRYSIPIDPKDACQREMLRKDKYVPVRYLKYNWVPEGVGSSFYRQVSWSGFATNIRERLQQAIRVSRRKS